MKIGILSDIHDHIPNLKKALGLLQGSADALICCGDLCSPFIMKVLGEHFHQPIHIVFGNNDGDLFRLTQVGRQFSQIHLHGELAEIEIGGKHFGVNHFDNIGRVLAESGRYDVTCFGHNHRFEITPSKRSLIINPGEVFGGLTGESSFVVYDTVAHSAEKSLVT